MGLQTSFYFSNEDERNFLTVLSERWTFEFCPVYQETIRFAENLDEYLTFTASKARYFLWSKQLSPPPVYTPAANVHVLDFSVSEVIEILRSKDESAQISMGRIYIQHEKIEGDQLVAKSKGFLDWFSAVRTILRSRSVDQFDGAFVWPDASARRLNGVQLTDHKLFW